MKPLQTPDQWPPPAEPLPTDRELNWSHWPIVGLIPRWIFASRRRNDFTWKMLHPIQDQIVSQLVDRNIHVDWPTKLHAKVAGLIARAIGDEKSIDPPALNPNDRFDLLFWGAYDDMTPLVFTFAFRDEFQIDIPQETMNDFYQQHRPISEFVNHCVARINRQAKNTA